MRRRDKYKLTDDEIAIFEQILATQSDHINHTGVALLAGTYKGIRSAFIVLISFEKTGTRRVTPLAMLLRRQDMEQITDMFGAVPCSFPEKGTHEEES